MSYDVTRIHWEVYAKNEDDLEEVLWCGKLHWVFVGSTRVPIAPLSHYGGSLLDLQMASQLKPLDPAGDLEKLAAAHRQLEWDATLRDFRIGQGHLFRGLLVLVAYPVCIPSNTQAGIDLIFDNEVQLNERVRIKLVLPVQFKTIVEVG
jgi:hypothetical protein